MAQYKQVIGVRKDLGMRKGKMIAQGAHASRGACSRANSDVITNWEHQGQTKIVVGVATEGKLIDVYNKAESGGVPAYIVKDAGHTELEPGTRTAFAVGPAKVEKVDKYTENLSLL